MMGNKYLDMFSPDLDFLTKNLKFIFRFLLYSISVIYCWLTFNTTPKVKHGNVVTFCHPGIFEERLGVTCNAVFDSNVLIQSNRVMFTTCSSDVLGN